MPKYAQQPRIGTSHLRGLSVANDQVIWVSGTNSFFARSTDGGTTWHNGYITADYSVDFRDIHGFDSLRAVAMSSGYPATVYTTEDGGQNWHLAYINKDSAAFLNGIDVMNNESGYIYGDPIAGKMLLLHSSDGMHWKEVPAPQRPAIEEGLMGYAASGTGIIYNENGLFIILGGAASKVIHTDDGGKTWTSTPLPMVTGEGKGPFSFCAVDDQPMVAVGGSYVDSTDREGNIAIWNDSVQEWTVPKGIHPQGYRSVVAGTSEILICSGRTGTEYTVDGGRNWETLTTDPYYSCDFGREYAYLTGRSGRFGKVKLNP